MKWAKENGAKKVRLPDGAHRHGAVMADDWAAFNPEPTPQAKLDPWAAFAPIAASVDPARADSGSHGTPGLSPAIKRGDVKAACCKPSRPALN